MANGGCARVHFSADADQSRGTGAHLGLAPDRVYGSWQEMVEAEATLPPDERIHAVAIVTPNHLHHAVARAFLERGIHVICDKPLAMTVEEADDLCRLTASTGLVFAVTYNYSGYPLVKEARTRVRGGAIGQARKVVVEYSQGWLTELLEAEGHKQAEWRADPRRGGPSAVLGDIGSHAHHLLRYVTGLEVQRLFADLGTVVAGRAAHDDAVVLLELDGGVRGVLLASQIATGERNHLRLRVYGSEGGLGLEPGGTEPPAPAAGQTARSRWCTAPREPALRPPRPPPACLAATRRVSWRRSRTSTGRWRKRCGGGARWVWTPGAVPGPTIRRPEATRLPSLTSPPSATAPAASISSTPRSAATRRTSGPMHATLPRDSAI